MVKGLKTELQRLSKDKLVDLILELRTKYRPVEEYFDFFLNPNDIEVLEKYKKIIISEFFPKKGDPRCRFSVAKKQISSFKSLGADPKAISDLMLTLPETAIRFTYEFGDMEEAFYTSAENNFKAALKYINKQGLNRIFVERVNLALKLSECCGYGFPDTLQEIAVGNGFS